jgi:hypothetical protein
MSLMQSYMKNNFSNIPVRSRLGVIRKPFLIYDFLLDPFKIPNERRIKIPQFFISAPSLCAFL